MKKPTERPVKKPWWQRLWRNIRVKARTPASLVLYLLVRLAALITVGAFVALVGYVLYRGVPHLSLSMFSLEYNSENLSLLPSLINTVMMTAIALIIAVPLGIGAAIYLVEYARRGNKVVKVIRSAAETLSGVPSIVFGLFGALFFVSTLGWGLSLLAGAFTVAIMILPLVLRTTEEALKSVPDMFREGSFGLGAGKLRTIFRIVLPAAVPGILAGVILSVGRIVGETAALLYTSGAVEQVSTSLTHSSGATLALHMYNLSREGMHTGEAYATAVVLLVLVVGINGVSAFIAKRIARKTGA